LGWSLLVAGSSFILQFRPWDWRFDGVTWTGLFELIRFFMPSFAVIIVGAILVWFPSES